MSEEISQEPEERPVEQERRSHKRQHLRLNKFLRAGFVIPEYEETQGLYLSVVDLSQGGMRVSLDRMWPVDSDFELSLPLAGFGANLPAKVRLPCQVRWNKALHGGTWIHGLMFAELDSEQKSVVDTILANFSGVGARQHTRYDCFLPATIEREGEDGLTLQVRNISEGGFGFRGKLELEPGEDFVIKLGFIRIHLELKVRVQWRQSMEMGLFEYGCRFLEVDQEQTDSIQRYIHTKLNR